MWSGQLLKPILLFLLLFLATPLSALELRNLNLAVTGGSAQLTLELSDRAVHRIFMLDKPDRLVIDLNQTRNLADLAQLSAKSPLIKQVRGSVRNKEHFRLVLELTEPLQMSRSQIQPLTSKGYQLLLDLERTKRQEPPPPSKAAQPASKTDPLPSTAATRPESRVTTTTTKPPPAPAPSKAAPTTAAATQPPAPPPLTKPLSIKRATESDRRGRDIIIAIDAGHGGQDPGAISADRRLREKDIVLSIARKLKKLIDNEPGIRAVMTRDGDYFIPLPERPQIARKHKADLFLSIHADSFADTRASGSSVYTLSRRGATSEHARMLAQKENESDLIGGVTLEDKDDMLASVLLDLTQTKSIEFSNQAASSILRQLRGINRLHKSRVEQAGFRVLRSLDMPSVLIETAFISNPNEARRLNSSEYQYSLAHSILAGVRHFFHQNPPRGTRLAATRQHQIGAGESLDDIATTYHIPLQQLKEYNQLDDQPISTGQLLSIPES